MKKFNNELLALLSNIISIILTILSTVILFTQYNNSNILLELNNIFINNKDLVTILVSALGSIIGVIGAYLVFFAQERERYTKEDKQLIEEFYKKTIDKYWAKEFENTNYIDNIIKDYTVYSKSAKNKSKTKFISKLLSNKNRIFNLVVLMGYILFTLIILTVYPEQVNIIANSFIDTFKQICEIVEGNQSLIAILTAGCTLYAGIFAYNYSCKKEKKDEKKHAIDCIEVILSYLYSNFDNIDTIFNPNWSIYVNFIDDIDLRLDVIHILHSIEKGSKSNITKSSIKDALYKLNKSNVAISSSITA